MFSFPTLQVPSSTVACVEPISATGSSSTGATQVREIAADSQNDVTIVPNVNGLSHLEIYLRQLHREGQGYKAMRTSLRNDHNLDCSVHILRTWIIRESKNPGQVSARIIKFGKLRCYMNF